MSPSHVAADAVWESNGTYVLDPRDSKQALAEPVMALRRRFPSVVLAWLALGVAIDDSIFASETFFGSPRVDMARSALFAPPAARVCIGL